MPFSRLMWNVAERIECLAHIFSGLIPRVVAGLLLVVFAREWSLLFVPVLVTNHEAGFQIWGQSHNQADSRFKTDINLNHTQMLQIFGSILLPGCAPSNWARKNKHKIVLDINIIIILIIPGIHLVSPGSQISLVSVNYRKKNNFTRKNSACFKCFKADDRMDEI